jgi:hypothetical protein
MSAFIRVLASFCFCLAVYATQASASDLPEWDGVYFRYQDNSYEEIKPVLSSVKISTSPQGDTYYTTTDYTVIPASKFKGIYIKGKDFTKKVSFYPMRRDTEMSWGNLFSRKQGKFIDRFVLESNRIRFTPRSRQEGTDGFYYEPLPDALHFFGAVERGCFVQLFVGNGNYFIFGIGAEAPPEVASEAVVPEGGANAK